MKGHGKDMTQKQLMEKLELSEPDTVNTVMEWLSYELRHIKPTEFIKCPECEADIAL